MDADGSSQRSYVLTIVQQPKRAKATAGGDRKQRRAVEPYPFVRLRLIRPDGTEDLEGLIAAQLVMHATLYDETGQHESTTMRRGSSSRDGGDSSGGTQPAVGDVMENNLALATNVTSGHRAYDLEEEEGFFFCFADIRVAHPGRYRLRLSLIQLPRVCPEQDAAKEILTYIDTEPFRVYSPKDYPGAEMSTPLTIKLAKQIPNIRTRNKNRMRHGHDSDDDSS